MIRFRGIRPFGKTKYTRNSAIIRTGMASILNVTAPTNAAIGITSAPSRVAGHCNPIAITAPSPAPEATPMMYGSASGLRNSP